MNHVKYCRRNLQPANRASPDRKQTVRYVYKSVVAVTAHFRVEWTRQPTVRGRGAQRMIKRAGEMVVSGELAR